MRVLTHDLAFWLRRSSMEALMRSRSGRESISKTDQVDGDGKEICLMWKVREQGGLLLFDALVEK